MSTSTQVLGLNLWDPEDRLGFKQLNGDNEALERVLAPIVKDSRVTSAAARINAYNNMKSMRYLAHLEHITTEKMAMFFDDFDSAAPYTSQDALLMTEKHGYVFSVAKGSSMANGNAGDVGTEMRLGAAFSFEAPISGYITAIEVDVKATNGANNCYIRELIVGDSAKKTITMGQMTGTRSTLTYSYSAPVAIHKGDIISGTLITSSSGYYGEAYGAVLGEPYVKFYCTPAPQSGWLKTELEPLGNMGHSEVRAYIQGIKETGSSVTATLIDADGNETAMESVGTRSTVTPAGVSCEEIEFVASYSETEAQLRIDVDAADGYADIYNYAVIGI